MICLYCGDYGCEECSSFDVESSRMYLELKAQLKASQDEVRSLRELIQGVDNIVHDSIGVAGYHNNGDIASWYEFEEIVEIQNALTNNQASETKGEG